MSKRPASQSARLRDSFAAIREFIVVLAMLSLLLAPGRVKQVLHDAGIRSLAGVEFDTKALAESDAEMEKARNHVQHLMAQLEAVHQELAQATQQSGQFYDPGIDTALQHLADAQKTTIQTEMNLNRSRAKRRDMLERLGRPVQQEADMSSADVSQAAREADAPQQTIER